jgi:hypothetical protein
MVRAIREIVTAGTGGRVQLDVPELKAGDRAEVIVLLGELGDASRASPADPIDALGRLQRAAGLGHAAAAAWATAATDERHASSRL